MGHFSENTESFCKTLFSTDKKLTNEIGLCKEKKRSGNSPIFWTIVLNSPNLTKVI